MGPRLASRGYVVHNGCRAAGRGSFNGSTARSRGLRSVCAHLRCVVARRFNGSTAREPWLRAMTACRPSATGGFNGSTARSRGYACDVRLTLTAIASFNGSTAREPWLLASARARPAARRRLQWVHGSRAVVTATHVVAPPMRGSCFNGSTAREPWLQQHMRPCPAARGDHASMGPRLASRGYVTDRRLAATADRRLQWVHGSEPWLLGVSVEHVMPSRRFNGSTAREPWLRDGRAAATIAHASFNGSTAREPWLRTHVLDDGPLAADELQWVHGSRAVVYGWSMRGRMLG